MLKEAKFPLLVAFTSVSDLISPKVVGQSRQVSYIVLSIAREMGFPRKQVEELAIAGLFHDIGIFSLAEKMGVLQFQLENASKHSQIGARLLAMSSTFSNASSLIRFHHHPWKNGAGAEFNGENVPLGSHILHLADRIAVLVDREQEVLGQAERITRQIQTHSNKLFVPEIVDIFASLAQKECFWFDIASIAIGETKLHAIVQSTDEIDMDGLMELARLFARIVDFKSRFTATHTCGVAIIAESLARLAGFLETECLMMQVAGNLHDLGNLYIPAEITKKHSALTKKEFNLIRQHAFHTFRALEVSDNLGTINEWASYHHERTDGTGYPFHLNGKNLSPGCRIMAVADIFTALTEDRPYRKGMTPDNSLAIVEEMAHKSALDSEVVKLLKTNFNQINSSRMTAQLASVEQYNSCMSKIVTRKDA